MTAIDMVHVPYKGSGPAIQDVLSGRVQLFITTPPSIIGHIQQGKLRAIAVASGSRHPMLPDRSEEHTSELQSLMRISYAVFCLKKKNDKQINKSHTINNKDKDQ